MKFLSERETKYLTLNLFLVSCLIAVYCVFTQGAENIRLFRVIIPIVWGMFVIFTITGIIMQHHRYRTPINFGMGTMVIGTEHIFFRGNLLTVLVLVAFILTYNMKNMSVLFYSMQPVFFNFLIVLIMLNSLYGATREKVFNYSELMKPVIENIHLGETLSKIIPYAIPKSEKELEDNLSFIELWMDSHEGEDICPTKEDIEAYKKDELESLSIGKLAEVQEIK